MRTGSRLLSKQRIGELILAIVDERSLRSRVERIEHMRTADVAVDASQHAPCGPGPAEGEERDRQRDDDEGHSPELHAFLQRKVDAVAADC
jgi:hypothetical protein